MSELPKSWASCRFGDIAKIRNGFAFKSTDFIKSNPSPSDVPLVRQSQLKGSKVDLSDAVYLPASFLKELEVYVLKKGDIIIGMSGSIGKVCLYDADIPALQNQRTGKIELFSEGQIDAKFYGLFLSSIEGELVKLSKGMGVQNISAKDIENLPLYLPPLNEQKRIVAKIEELFSELDSGIESLKTAREQLKVYRQAVLKHAFEGKLTAPWREKNKDKLESADQLLARIKREREDSYKQQLSAWKKGEVTSKPRQIKEFSDLNSEELSGLEILPAGWAWAKVISLFDVVSGGTPKGIEETKGSDIPFYKVSDMNNAGNETYMHTAAIYLSESERAELGLTCYPAGTVIFPKRGGAILTNKKRMLSQPSCFDLNIMGVISTAPSILKDYLWYWFQKLDLAKIYDGSNVPQINNKNIDPLPFPVCSLHEQLEIIKLLNAHISAIESTEKEIETNLQKSDALRQSILKKAFSGQLVAQNPADEPASVLLERIRSEKAIPKPTARKPKEKRRAA